jgi:Spy/CpxP family protein refolding chaperone
MSKFKLNKKFYQTSILKGAQMKNLILIFSFAIFTFSLAVYAQGRFTPQERLKMLKDRLSLTDEQSAKVEKILIKSDSELKNLRASENPDRASFRKIMDDSNNEILKVLNEKQKAEFNKMLEERRNRQQQRRNNPNNN